VHRAEMYIFGHSKIKGMCPLRTDLGKSLQVRGGEKGLLRVALLVVFWRRGVTQWLPLDRSVRSWCKFLFLPGFKTEAGLGKEAAVGEDAEDIEHPEKNANATAYDERESAAFPG